MGEVFKRWLIIGPVLLYSVILHEMSHGYVALLNGDPTALNAGRLTLNPIPHIDLFGSILLPLVQIVSRAPFFLAWAKPVPYNPALFVTEVRLATLEVALAGPFTNMLLALMSTFVLRAVGGILGGSRAGQLVRKGLVFAVMINVSLMIFNFMPIPPLDGFTLVRFFFPVVDRLGIFNNFMTGIVILMLVLYVARNFLTKPAAALTSALLDWAIPAAPGEDRP